MKAKETERTVSIVLPATILTLGLLLFLVGFLGCFGACYNNTCMLKTVGRRIKVETNVKTSFQFAVIVGILLLAEIIAAIVLLVYRHEVSPF